MAKGDVSKLSVECDDLLGRLYDAGHREVVRAMLLELKDTAFGPPHRVRYDVLSVAGGSVEKVRELVNLALRDPRDVMSLEYSQGYPHEWARVHAVNMDRERPK